jgi:hypothetical protein
MPQTETHNAKFRRTNTRCQIVTEFSSLAFRKRMLQIRANKDTAQSLSPANPYDNDNKHVYTLAPILDFENFPLSLVLVYKPKRHRP